MHAFNHNDLKKESPKTQQLKAHWTNQPNNDNKNSHAKLNNSKLFEPTNPTDQQTNR
jgi:hypothetical protein